MTTDMQSINGESQAQSFILVDSEKFRKACVSQFIFVIKFRF